MVGEATKLLSRSEDGNLNDDYRERVQGLASVWLLLSQRQISSLMA